MSSSRQPGKILPNSYFCELVHARAARHDHRLDVEIVERVGDAMEQHAVVGDDPLPALAPRPPPSADSRSRGSPAAAPSARRRARASPASRDPPARTAARSRSPGNRTPRRHPRPPSRIADDRDDRVVLDVEERARRALRQSARHRLVDEVDDLRLERRRCRRSRGGCRVCASREPEALARARGRAAARE